MLLSKTKNTGFQTTSFTLERKEIDLEKWGGIDKQDDCEEKLGNTFRPVIAGLVSYLLKNKALEVGC